MMESLNIIYDEVHKKLDLQRDNISSIDQKTGIVIGFSGAICGIVASVYTSTETHLVGVSIGLGASMLALLISLIVGSIAFWSRKYYADPDPEGLEKNYLEEPEKKTKRQILSNLVFSYKKNKKVISNKLKLAKASLLFMTIGVIFLVSTMFYKEVTIMSPERESSTEQSPESSPPSSQPVEPDPALHSTFEEGQEITPDAALHDVVEKSE